MSNIPARSRHTIYDYSAYDTTQIPLEGEKRYFDNILTGITHPCYVLGDGSTQINSLKFQGIINIKTDVNINLGVLAIDGNRVCINNTKAGSITVTAGAYTRTLYENEIVEFRYNGSEWRELYRNYGMPLKSIIAWHKDFSASIDLPDNWVECNGQVLSDSESPFDGETIPNLNGDAGGANSPNLSIKAQMFLRGGTISGNGQEDAAQKITGSWDSLKLTSGFSNVRSANGAFSIGAGGNASAGLDTTAVGSYSTDRMSFDNANSTSPNTAKTDDEETRPVNMSVVWIMKIK